MELFHALYAKSQCFVIRYAEQFSMAWSMFFKLGFGPPDIFFFARYKHDTYFLLPFRKHMTWLDSAECTGFFFFFNRTSLLLRRSDEPHKWRNRCLQRQPIFVEVLSESFLCLAKLIFFCYSRSWFNYTYLAFKSPLKVCG